MMTSARAPTEPYASSASGMRFSMMPHSPGTSAIAATKMPLTVIPSVSGMAMRVTSALVDFRVA